MKGIVQAAAVVSVLTAGLVGCSHYDASSDKDAAVIQQVNYDGRVVSHSDMVIYRKNPRHVFVYDGVRYRVHHHDHGYVYYRVN